MPASSKKPPAAATQRWGRCPAWTRFPRAVSSPWLSPRLFDFAGQQDRRWSADAAILTHAPEVHDHEDGRDDGNADAVPDVCAQERVRVHDRAAKQSEADVVIRRHAQL